MAAAEEVIGEEENAGRNDWFDDECSEVTKEKNVAYAKMQTQRTKVTVKKYQAKRRVEKRIHKSKKAYYNKELQNIQKLNKENEYRKFYKKVT